MTTVAALHDLPFRWLGGAFCLDFANTVAWLSGADCGLSVRPRAEYERFTSYARVVAWAREAGIVPEQDAASLLEAADSNPESAAHALQTAISLREAIHFLFLPGADDGGADSRPLETLNRVMVRGLARRSVRSTDTGFSWAWESGGQSLEAPLWPVALSAAELLTSHDRRRVRQCRGNDCGFLFLDKGRGPGRRWCDMAHCGNRAKARHHYRRTRGHA